MNFASIANSLRQGNWYYFFGRFYFFRVLYSFFRKYFDSFSVPETPTSAFQNEQIVIFKNIDSKMAVSEIKKKAVATGFNLPMEYVKEIYHYACSAICVRSGDDRKLFTFPEVIDGKLSDGLPVVLGIVKEPMQCEAVDRIAREPRLLETCTRYLRCRPRKIEPRLFWSFIVDLSPEERKDLWQTVEYHFDVYGFNFMYANFYITDCDKLSGAHVMIDSSHKKKPLRMLLHSAYQMEQSIFEYYGFERERVIEGPAGTGFVQDSSCYHKALAPVKSPRLLLQFRIQ